ncbi:MAG: hypothetical protein RIM23_30225 [Coleofasciculus sp. G3-WIS-01]|uniref:hypothetical protein n=1 Tax=Coleofasciculus sp. G3-WIS-01 TaxID=3069528 RepID=UPI0032F37077
MSYLCQGAGKVEVLAQGNPGSGVAHLNWWIRIVGAHGVRPSNRQIYSSILAVSHQ